MRHRAGKSQGNQMVMTDEVLLLASQTPLSEQHAR